MSHWLVVMGSGETTPTMVATHQRVLGTLGDRPRAVLLDTPYGFQENADELTSRTQDYFARNVGTPVEVVSLRDAAALTPVREEELVARVAEAGWVFAGPGSPTFLTRQWRATRLPPTLRERLGRAGATVFASAAACTLGALTVPVYEIYKAGETPHWREGLDLLTGIGLDAVTIPHFDNREGGTHDTRFCYLGERRLRQMEALLPEATWVLGVDEHTALLLELTGGRVRVEGRGGVTVRAREVSAVFPGGTEVGLETLLEAARGMASPVGTMGRAATEDATGAPDDAPGPAAPTGAVGAAEMGTATLPGTLAEEVAAARQRFDGHLAAHAAIAAAEVTVELAATIRAWSADTLQSDEVDRAHAELRRQVVALARVAQPGLHAHRELVAPHVELLLRLREQARSERRFGDADAIRDALIAGGVEVRDHPDGTAWEYHDPLERALDDG